MRNTKERFDSMHYVVFPPKIESFPSWSHSLARFPASIFWGVHGGVIEEETTGEEQLSRTPSFFLVFDFWGLTKAGRMTMCWHIS